MAISTLGVISGLVTTIVFIFVDALLLMLSAKIFKLRDTSYRTGVIVSAIVLGFMWVVGILVSLVFNVDPNSLAGADLAQIGSVLGAALGIGLVTFLLGLFLATLFIRQFYGEEWGRSALVMIVWKVFAWIAQAILLIPLVLILGLVVVGQ